MYYPYRCYNPGYYCAYHPGYQPGYHPGYHPGYYPGYGYDPYQQKYNNNFVPSNPWENLPPGNSWVPFTPEDFFLVGTSTRKIAGDTWTTVHVISRSTGLSIINTHIVPDKDKLTITEVCDCNGCLQLMEECAILECCKGFMCKYCQDHGKPCQKCSGDKNTPLGLTEANVNRWNNKAEIKAQDDRDSEELKEAIDQCVGIQTKKN